MIAMITFAYLHRWMPYEEKDYSDFDVEKNFVAELNELGQEGRELVNMTPDWGEVEAPNPMPDYISGWYCTFKRQLE